MFCEICGSKVSEYEKYCSKCNEPNPSYRSTQPTPAVSNSPDKKNEAAYTYKVSNVKKGKTLTSGVVLSDDESLVRSYTCSELRFPKCVGFLSVTTRRVIFHGTSDNSRVVDEVALDSISGISTFYGSKILFKRIIIGLVALIVSILMISQNVQAGQQSADIWGMATRSFTFPPLLIIAGFVIALICFILSHRKVFFLKIYSSKATAAPIMVGEGYGGAGGNSAVYAISALPTSETDTMMKELGAMINDLQALGELGVEKWKK